MPTSAGLLDFGFLVHHYLLVPLESWGELGLPEFILGCQVTCMSDQASSADIRGLTSAIQALTLAVTGRPAEPASPAGSESTVGDWSVVGVEAQDIRIAEDSRCAQVRFRGVEEGPGEIPPILLDIARSKLSSKPPGAEFRALRAFRAGFWSKAAIATSTVYRPIDPVPELKARHWIVLACPAFPGTARFTSRSDFGRAIEGDIENSVFEVFASQTELEIYCAGASVPLPALKTWKKQASSTSARGIPASSSGTRQ